MSDPGDPRALPDPLPDLSGLERALGHDFADRDLLLTSVTHSSFANEVAEAESRDNEALEFLGDAVLAFVLADQLYREHPWLDEGRLSRHKSLLEKAPTLAAAARRLGLGGFLRLGRGERRSGGADNDRILAGAFEAVVAATYLDGGMAAARGLIRRALAEDLRRLDPENPVSDTKTALQEHLQGRGRPAPRYRVVEETGADHRKRFRVVVSVGEEDLGEGWGTTKRGAQQEAARRALEALTRGAAPGDEEE